ncbi:MAG: nucleotidyltransferase [Actinomycetota bacterium]|nr:nucleotidyltransferase [Actinomycetota bacterium]
MDQQSGCFIALPADFVPPLKRGDRSVGPLPFSIEWQATRPDGSPEARRLPTPGRPLHLRTVHGLVDLLAEQPSPLDLNGLPSRSDERRIDGVPAPICSLADLVALKRQAGRPTDLEDLNRLETAHGPLPDPPADSSA